MTRSPLGISRKQSWRPGSHDAVMRPIMKMTASSKALGQTFYYDLEWDPQAYYHHEWDPQARYYHLEWDPPARAPEKSAWARICRLQLAPAPRRQSHARAGNPDRLLSRDQIVSIDSMVISVLA